MKTTITDQIAELKDKLKSFEDIAKEFPEAYYSESNRKFVFNKLNVDDVKNYILIVENFGHKYNMTSNIICHPYVNCNNKKVFITANGWTIGYIHTFNTNNHLSIKAVEFKKIEKYSNIFFKVAKELATVKHNSKSTYIKFTNKNKKVPREKLDYYEKLLNRYEILA